MEKEKLNVFILDSIDKGKRKDLESIEIKRMELFLKVFGKMAV